MGMIARQWELTNVVRELRSPDGDGRKSVLPIVVDSGARFLGTNFAEARVWGAWRNLHEELVERCWLRSADVIHFFSIHCRVADCGSGARCR